MLVLMASLAILEGYAWLNVIPRDRLDTTAIAFPVVLLPVAVFLTGRGRAGRRPVQWVLVAATILLLAVTGVAILHDTPTTEHLMGVTDLAVAGAALLAAVGGERSVFRRH